MGLSFVSLLYLQLSYIKEMAKMKKEQFDESVYRSLYQASRNLEMNETKRYLEKDLKAGIKIAGRNINHLRYADDTILMAESK